MRDLNALRSLAAAALLLPLAAQAAEGRQRLAVLIVDDDDPGLADDITEVAIATLAERRDRELVGARELRSRLAGVVPDGRLGACLERPACLAEVGAAAGVERAVIGHVRASGEDHVLELALLDTRTAETLARVPATTATAIEGLFATVRADVGQLLAPPPEVAPPPVVLARTEPRRLRAWAPYVGVTATALAAISLSAGTVTGTLAEQDPVGADRRAAQADLGRREGYAATANMLLIAGSALLAAAGAAFVWWWRDGRSD